MPMRNTAVPIQMKVAAFFSAAAGLRFIGTPASSPRAKIILENALCAQLFHIDDSWLSQRRKSCTIMPRLRSPDGANGSHECAPDDRLREAIQSLR
jgi:hypothetical protein